MSEAGWSGGELARAVNRAGTTFGLRLRYDRTSVAHWLSGSLPRPPVPDLVAAEFSRRLDRLVTAAETGLADPRRTAGSGDPVETLLTLCRQDAQPGTRAELAGLVYLPVPAPVVPDCTGTPRTRRRVRPDDPRRLEAMTRVFAGLMRAHGGAHARTALVAYLADDAAHLLTADTSQRIRQDVFAGAARLTHLLGTMTLEADLQGLAQRYFHHAAKLASFAGDRTVLAVALRALSAQALHLGHRRHAVDLGELAAVHAVSAGPAPSSFVHAQLAPAYARAGLLAEARSALTTAEDIHPGDMSGSAPFTVYPQAALEYQRAQTFAALGTRKRAVASLRRSLALRPAEDHRGHALTAARLAEVLALTGEVEEACSYWEVFLSLYPRIRSARAEEALARIHLRLRPFTRLRAAAAVREQANALVESPHPPSLTP
ncbi:tetratricopeptide repeat protein [Streptomyces niveiscabiei]|uniref:Transcriptional regulator n=2 Tax=Streptomyces niveiscabiei TaxID=164115 RepID=A0ABW9HGE9_9ACTN